ncbi:Gfo/Idh/MocA family protein, partial [Longispora fulva]|uniref:Gfo/Idh/MocA family protein n=3 Tax=Bacteria TaxID=2 RepID=UPI00363BD1D2
LSVNHNRRYDSDVRTVQKLLKEKKLGDIVEYETHFDRFRPQIKPGWKEQEDIAGSGIVYDLGSHLIDQALTLFGKPEAVYADIRIQRKMAKVPDNFEILLLYPHLKVTLKAGMLVNGKGPTISIFGT